MKAFAASIGLCSIAFCALLTGRAVAQRPTPSRYTASRTTAAPSIPRPVGVETDSHFQRILANSQVKVFRLTIATNEATLVVPHPHDYIVVSLGANQIEAVGEVSRFALDLNDGETQVLTGGWSHKLVNKAEHPASLLILEVVRGISPRQSVCGLSGHLCDEVRFGKTDDGRYSQTVLFETSTVRLLRAELGPGGVLPTHTDATDHLIVTLSEARLSDGHSEGTTESAGHATWASGRLGTVRNLGSEDARMLILEIK